MEHARQAVDRAHAVGVRAAHQQLLPVERVDAHALRLVVLPEVHQHIGQADDRLECGRLHAADGKVSLPELTKALKDNKFMDQFIGKGARVEEVADVALGKEKSRACLVM